MFLGAHVQQKVSGPMEGLFNRQELVVDREGIVVGVGYQGMEGEQILAQPHRHPFEFIPDVTCKG